MFEAKQICFKASGLTLLDDVSLQVTPGQVTALLGPNGAGKSTLLSVFSQENMPASGTVYLNGQPLSAYSRLASARLRAVLPQKSSLSFGFRAQEVVEMGRLPHQGLLSPTQERDIVEDAMALVQITHLRDRAYTRLSGGEQQRVHLARVLCQIWSDVGEQPRYLLLDEPTSALDLEHQHHVMNIVREFATSAGIGVLAVLHDLNLAAMYADQIAVIKAGKIEACDEPFAVITSDMIQRIFHVDAGVKENPYLGCPLVISKQRSDSVFNTLQTGCGHEK
ncbi:MAG TPA: heme ABC transporter ATP-binding protein [Gammaproteobacteria bacterium]|jgi:iron complex transport system ATP-binding protein|nr:heme ABC transporter ATP-binding protein [Gammaproteobacteria bacterium]